MILRHLFSVPYDRIVRVTEIIHPLNALPGCDRQLPIESLSSMGVTSYNAGIVQSHREGTHSTKREHSPSTIPPLTRSDAWTGQGGLFRIYRHCDLREQFARYIACRPVSCLTSLMINFGLKTSLTSTQSSSLQVTRLQTCTGSATNARSYRHTRTRCCRNIARVCISTGSDDARLGIPTCPCLLKTAVDLMAFTICVIRRWF